MASNVSVKWLNRYTTFVKEGESLPGNVNNGNAFLNKVTPTHSLVTTNNIDNRLASLIEGRESKFGELFYTGEQDNAFCTIAIRRVSPSIYTGDSSLIKYN